jgi:hypothetical protein
LLPEGSDDWVKAALVFVINFIAIIRMPEAFRAFSTALIDR